MWFTPIFASHGFRSRSPLSSEERGDRERNPWLAKMGLHHEQNKKQKKRKFSHLKKIILKILKNVEKILVHN